MRSIGRGRRRRIRACKHPIRCLAMPDQCVAGALHFVAQPEVHECVRRSEIVTVLALPGVNECPLHVVLCGNLRFDERDVVADLLRGAAKPLPVTMLRLTAVPTVKWSLKASFSVGGASAELDVGVNDQQRRREHGNTHSVVRVMNFHGDNLILRSFTGAPASSRKRMAPCQLPCSLMILKTTTLSPLFRVTVPLSASSSRVRASVKA